MNVLSQLIIHGDRDDLECILATIMKVFDKIEAGDSSLQWNNLALNGINESLAAENAKLKADIEGLRKIIDNERAAGTVKWDYMP